MTQPGAGWASNGYEATRLGIAERMRLLFIGLLVAAAIYLLSAGHILFLPLLFFLPLGLFGGRRRQRGYGGGLFGRSRTW